MVSGQSFCKITTHRNQIRMIKFTNVAPPLQWISDFALITIWYPEWILATPERIDLGTKFTDRCFNSKFPKERMSNTGVIRFLNGLEQWYKHAFKECPYSPLERWITLRLDGRAVF